MRNKNVMIERFWSVEQHAYNIYPNLELIKLEFIRAQTDPRYFYLDNVHLLSFRSVIPSFRKGDVSIDTNELIKNGQDNALCLHGTK